MIFLERSYPLAIVHFAIGALLDAGCFLADPPPAWAPGDAPMQLHVKDDDLWLVMEEACVSWAVVGLECERVAQDCDDAIVVSWASERWWGPTGKAYAGFEWNTSAWGWDITIDFLREFRDTERMPYLAAHEIGHVLGIWDHVDDPGALMFGTPIVTTPQEIDLAALPYDL
jgi:hypothetical protein